MPFDTDLPAENTDPWYVPLTNAWTALKTFVNGLESSLAGKVTAAGSASTLWLGTQAAYDAIATKDPATVYVIQG